MFPTNGNVFICTNLETRLETQNSVATRDGVRFKWVNRRRFLSSVRFECKLNSQFHCPMYTSLLVHQTDRGKDSCDNFILCAWSWLSGNLGKTALRLIEIFRMYFDTSLKTSRRDCSGISCHALVTQFRNFFFLSERSFQEMDGRDGTGEERKRLRGLQKLKS